MNAPGGVLERRLDGVQAKKAKRPVPIGVGPVVPLGFRPGRRTRAAVGKPGEALFLAPRFTEMIFWQDTSRGGCGPGSLAIQRIWLWNPCASSRSLRTLQLCRLTGKALVKITRAKALPRSAGRFHLDGGARRTSGGEVPEWLKGTDCKSVGFAYAGSNPALSTKTPSARATLRPA